MFVGLSPRPLVCELFANDTNTGTWVTAECPYPTSEHVYAIETWRQDTSGMRCAGNNDLTCGASETPLALAVHNSVVEILGRAQQLQGLLDTEQRVADCSYAADTIAALSANEDTRANFAVSWIALTVAGALGSVAG